MQRRALLVVALAAVAIGCREVTPPDRLSSPDAPALAKGGIPGPPPHVIVRAPRGPVNAPVPLPSKAGPPSFLTDIVDIGAGRDFSCALRSDGVAFCWGDALLGDGSYAGSSVPVEVSGPQRYERLEVGDANACGLTRAGELYCWGDNFRGQLGTGQNTSFSATPVAVSGGHVFTDVDVGLQAICGLATDGVTYCWGDNSQGQLGIGTAGGSRNGPTPVVNSPALGFVGIEIGFFHACGLTGAGQLHCWGSSSMFGNGATGPSVPTPTLAAGAATFASVSVGSFYTCGLDAAGTATCWGTMNFSGQLGLGSFAAPVLTPQPVAGALQLTVLDAHDNNAFVAFTCGLSNGAAWCWGSNQFGQLGAITSDACMQGPLAFGCSSTPVPVGGGLSLQDIAVGLNHACGLDVAGRVWCWGSNQGGALGDGTMVNSMIPVLVSGLDVPQQAGWIDVSPGTAQLQLLGSTLQLTALAVDEDGVPLAAQPTFAWSSSNPAAAPVDAGGLVTALVDGNVTITAVGSNGQSGRAELSIRIVDPVVAFASAWVGGTAPASADGIVILGGLLADEWGHSGTFTGRRAADMRSLGAGDLELQRAYDQLVLARTALEFEANRLRTASPADPRIGHMLALAGYTYIAFAEAFCSGVPVSDPNAGLSTADLFTEAVARFSAAFAGPVASPHDVLARVGLARAQLGLGDFAGAATQAAMIPTPFQFSTSHSVAAPNRVWALSIQSPRVTVSDGEGVNGLAFRSANDARVPWVFAGLGFNGVTPHYALQKYPSASSNLVFASGVEARLIEAEAALAGGNAAQYLGLLNDLRAIAGLPAVVDPGTAVGRQDLLFSERALWLFATGQRLGDLRRLIAQYGRSAASLLPVGSYPLLGGTYGTDANLPVPTAARGPAYAGCTVRDR